MNIYTYFSLGIFSYENFLQPDQSTFDPKKTLYLLIESLDIKLIATNNSYLVNAAGTPPSTVNIHPVVRSDFDEAKNAMDSAISDG